MVSVQSSPPHRPRTRPIRDVEAQPTESTTTTGSTALLWIGTDDRGELEIVAAVLPDLYLVIHVMPTALRRER